MTSYRNVRFGFEGDLRGMYLYTLVLPLALPFAGIGLGLLALQLTAETLASVLFAIGILGSYAISPWVHLRLAMYLLNGYRFGEAAFSGTPSTLGFYGIYLKAVGLTVLISLTSGAIVYLLDQLDVVSLAGLLSDDETSSDPMAILFVLGMLPFYLLTGVFVVAFFSVRLRALLFRSAALDNRIAFESKQTAIGLWWLIISNFLIRVLSGGLGTPWTQVRTAAYDVDRTVLFAENDLGSIVDEQRNEKSSLGEEFAEAFDGSLDVGF